MRVTIIGGGYVGLPLAAASAAAGHDVCVFDVDEAKVSSINDGVSYIDDVRSDALANIQATTNPHVALFQHQPEVVLICVPTPLQHAGDPDVRFVLAAVDDVDQYLEQPDALVILESTVYPGFTREQLVERFGDRFAVAFSPERIDPANTVYGVTNTPKVVGGSPRAAAFYRSLGIPAVVELATPDEAEMVKILENTFRAVNIALVNELSLACRALGIDIWSVIDAASTKPFGFMPFYPGPGVGGHCLLKTEWIWVRKRGRVYPIRLEDFVDECVPFNEHDVLSLNRETGKTEFAKLTAVSVRDSKHPLLRVHTRDHREVTVTRKHPMLVWREGGIHTVEARHLELGDHIIVAKSWPEPEVWDGRFDVLNAMRQASLSRMRVEPISGNWQDYDDIVRPACKAVGVLAKDVYRTNGLPDAAYRLLEEQGAQPFSHDELMIRTGKGNSCRTHPAVINIDEDFARLIGYYLAEGCSSADGKTLRTCFCFGSHETDLIEDCVMLLQRVGVTPSIYRSKQWQSVTIKVTSYVFGTLIRTSLHCGTESEDVRVPDILMGAPASIRTQVLIGMLRGDGGVGTGHGCVNYFSSSPELFQQAIMLLQGLGFVPYFDRSRAELLELHNVQIERMIEYFTREKRRRLEDYRDGRVKPMPPKSYVDRGDFVTSEITSVRQVPADTVYSLEVDKTHTFVTSYGIVVHNCIGPDPKYLTWRLRTRKLHADLVELAADINTAMPRSIVDRLAAELNDCGVAVRGTRVLVVGCAYKPNVTDTRESPAHAILAELQERGAIVGCYDPVVDPESSQLIDEPWDCAVLVTDHDVLDYGKVADLPLILDTRDAFRRRGIQGRGKAIPL